MKTFFVLSLFLVPFFLLAGATDGHGTVEYARQTGRACGYCHVDPSGGSALTRDGEAFRDSLRIKGQYRELTMTQHVVRFIVGYVHMMTAIIWFGTILYVHIVLKPAYAAQGLPRGELTLGWASIIVLAVTGTLLSLARVPSWHMLFHTRFGILLTIKVFLFLIMVSTAVFVTFVVGPRLRKRREQGLAGPGGDMGPDRLPQYDGKDGRPAYIAYKGMIYDVTQSKLWREGNHFRKHQAGTDLTGVIKTAPHGEDKVLNLHAVGKLLAERGTPRPPHLKVFYFFAYMNLFLIFAIVFVISLWRWW